jgi:hypothetical protein
MSFLTDNKNNTLTALGAISALSVGYGLYRIFSSNKQDGPDVPVPKPCYPYVGKYIVYFIVTFFILNPGYSNRTFTCLGFSSKYHDRWVAQKIWTYYQDQNGYSNLVLYLWSYHSPWIVRHGSR